METGTCLKTVDGLHTYQWADGNLYQDEYRCVLCGASHIEESLGR